MIISRFINLEMNLKIHLTKFGFYVRLKVEKIVREVLVPLKLFKLNLCGQRLSDEIKIFFV
jgi:hypothetical protein